MNINTHHMAGAIAATAAMALASCGTGRISSADAAEAQGAATPPPVQIGEVAQKPLISGVPPNMAMPEAVAYRMSGDYAGNVPVALAPDGTLLSYPAPSDIPANPLPVALGNGWYVSPVGIGASTVFTSYTYTEYRSLPQAPTPEEIMAHVIPSARVTSTLPLPMTLSEALADPAAAAESLRVH